MDRNNLEHLTQHLLSQLEGHDYGLYRVSITTDASHYCYVVRQPNDINDHVPHETIRNPQRVLQDPQAIGVLIHSVYQLAGAPATLPRGGGG